MGYKSPTSSLGITFKDAQSFDPQSVTKPSRGISDLSLPSFFLFNEREHKSSMLRTYLSLTYPPTYALLNQFCTPVLLSSWIFLPRIYNNSTACGIKSKFLCWASLVAQWLRVCLPMQGTRVRALVWEDPTCRGAAGPMGHNR